MAMHLFEKGEAKGKKVNIKSERDRKKEGSNVIKCHKKL